MMNLGMELLCQYEKTGYIGSDLYYLLLNLPKIDEPLIMIPSVYNRELQMSAKERLKKLPVVPLEKLSIVPAVLLFQNWKTNDQVKAKVVIKNISQLLVNLALKIEESSNFLITPSGVQTSRLAPGMSLTLHVNFLPDCDHDYAHYVTLVTDTHKYCVPFLAISSRPVFDFPDEIVIPVAPIKMETSKRVYIRNIGRIAANCILRTDVPFYVNPDSVYLQPNEIEEVIVRFKSVNDGEFKGKLFVTFETGEHLVINLISSTMNIDVSIDKDVLRFQDTFNTMIKQLPLKITNRSNEKLAFIVQKYDSIEEDFNVKYKVVNMFKELTGHEIYRDRRLTEYKIMSSEEHVKIYSRILNDEIHSLAADKFLYENAHFSVEPLKSYIWSNTTTEIVVSFEPKSIGLIESKFYLDIEGVSGRIPIAVRGVSLPPDIRLGVVTLDIGNPFVNKEYKYEIPCSNKGHIPGAIRYRPTPTLFGSELSCEPDFLCLRSLQNKIFILRFKNTHKGAFFEELFFDVEDSNIQIKLAIKGETVYPTIRFEPTFLDFHSVELGVPKTLELAMINDTTVDVPVSAMVMTDGPNELSILLEDYAIFDFPKPALPKWPKEFIVQPSKVVLKGKSKTVVLVSLVANFHRTDTSSYLTIEILDCDATKYQVPMIFQVIKPNITLPGPYSVRTKTCFIDCVYKQEVEFYANCKTHFIAGIFQETDPVTGEQKKIECTFVPNEGLLDFNEPVKLEFYVKVFETGRHFGKINVRLFGKHNLLPVCDVIIIGQPPIVTAVPTQLSFGPVKVLRIAAKKLTLYNDTPMDIEYTSSFNRPDRKFFVDKPEGVLPAESIVDLTMNVFLTDSDNVSDKFNIHINYIKDTVVPLSATGFGTSIVVGETEDFINLGTHFIKHSVNADVEMKNMGTKTHILEWTYNFKQSRQAKAVAPFFQLSLTSQFKLGPGETQILNVKASSSKPCEITEIWYLVGAIEGANRKECLLECPISIIFDEPKLEYDPPELEMRYEAGPFNEYYQVTGSFTVKNVSRLPVFFDAIVNPPFYFVRQSKGHLCTNEDSRHNYDLLEDVSFIGESQSCNALTTQYIDYVTERQVPPVRNDELKLWDNINEIKNTFMLTNIISQYLKHDETMRARVVFDSTIHNSFKCKLFSDSILLNVRGNKIKDSIKVTGRISYPNVLITPSKVDFKCLDLKSYSSKTIKIENTTPLIVCYRFTWTNCKVKDTKEVIFSPAKSELYKPSAYTERPLSKETLTMTVSEVVPYRAPAPTSNGSFNSSSRSFNVIQGEVESQFDLEKEEAEPIYEAMDKKLLNSIIPFRSVSAEQNETLKWIKKYISLTDQPKYIRCSSLLDVTPHRGFLKSGEYQYVNILFYPDDFIDLHGILECQVLGGATEYVEVFGMSSSQQYMLSSQKINYKIRLFSERAKESIYLTNTSLLPFEFKALICELSTKRKDNIHAEIIEIEPMCVIVRPGEEIKIVVTIYPGIIGNFEITFYLEIGHNDIIPVQINGCGVIPQLYLSLKRAEVEKEKCYRAIGSLSQEYIEAVENIVYARGSNDDEETMSAINIGTDWHVCSRKDNYPSLMDIDLAVERLLIIEYISEHPDVLKTVGDKVVAALPQTITPPYIVDFGDVILGTAVSCTVQIVNYSPVTITPRIRRPNQQTPWLTIKLSGAISSGNNGHMEITMNPTVTHFKLAFQEILKTFVFEIPGGAPLPILVKGICATPTLSANVTVIDLKEIRCGDKITVSIPVQNNGKCQSIWYASLRNAKLRNIPFKLLNTSGTFESNEGSWVSFEFLPTDEGIYRTSLIFDIYMNPLDLAIPIRAQAIAPKVLVIGPNIVFPPTLPNHEAEDVYFGLMNPCPFPVEVVIPSIDSNITREKSIYDLLNDYYNKPAEMLISRRVAGDGLPLAVVEFYEGFKDHLQSVARNETQRATTARVRKGKKKSALNIVPSIISAVRAKTESELVLEYHTNMKEQNIDPLAKSRIDPDMNNSDELKMGIVIAFYSSPATEADTIELAYATGKKIKLPVINFDWLVVSAIIEIDCEAAFLLRSHILDTYETMQKMTTRKSVSSIKSSIIQDFLPPAPEEIDDMSTLFRMIEFISTQQKQTSVMPKTTSRKLSAARSVSQHDIGTISILPIELVTDLIKLVLQDDVYQEGFVVDTLNSLIIKSPASALQTILQCRPTFKTAHLIVTHTDLQTWLKTNEVKDFPSEETMCSEPSASNIDEIIEQVDQMNADEYEAAPSELIKIYIANALEERSEAFRAKLAQKNHDKAFGNRLSGTAVTTSKKQDTDLPNTLEEKLNKKNENKSVKTSTKKPDNESALLISKYQEYTTKLESLVAMINYFNPDTCDVVAARRPSVETNKKNTSKTKKTASVHPLIDTEIDPAFSMTIVVNKKPLIFKEAMISNIECSQDYIEARQHPEPVDLLKLPIKIETLTVMLPTEPIPPLNEDCIIWHELVEAPIPCCRCKSKEIILSGSAQDVRYLLNHAKCECLQSFKKEEKLRKKRNQSPTLANNEVQELSELHEVPTQPIQKSHFVLNPGEIARFKFSFLPTREGTHTVTNYVEIVGWPKSRIPITATGVCDMPRLDTRPKKMYPNFCRKSDENKIYSFVYLDDQNIFDCGYYFINSERTYEEKTEIKMYNVSFVPAELTFTFENIDQCFVLGNETINLAPGSVEFLTLKVAPDSEEVQNTIICRIKDNPEPIHIPITCHGVHPHIDVLPSTKTLDFGKLLLFRSAKLKFTIKNNSLLPVSWRIPDELDKEFKISQLAGMIERDSNEVVDVTYYAKQVKMISKLNFTVEVFDLHGRGEPLFTCSIFLVAECYDVTVECSFEDMDENCLNYGAVKINSQLSKTMFMVNKGKYDILYKIKKLKEFPEPKLHKTMKVTPSRGLLPPSLSMAYVEFQCSPTTKLDLIEVPAFSCTLYDGSDHQVIVAEFLINMSISSFYNTFTLHPQSELNFSVVTVGTMVSKILELANTSKCPLIYRIELPDAYKSKSISNTSQLSVKHSSKIKVSQELKCGNFTIHDEDNFLPPGANRRIRISFLATEPLNYREVIKIIVNDTCPAEADGVLFTLNGIGAVPTLDFWNLKNTFREHLIIRSLDEYKVSDGIPHCIFTENSATLHFFCSCIFKEYKACLDLYNNGLVPDALTFVIQSQSNTPKGTFSVDRSEMHIEPLTHGFVVITFAPKALEEYRATFDVKLKIKNGYSQSYKICLVGEGFLPRISVLEPPFDKEKTIVWKHPLTFVGEETNRAITMTSICPMQSTVSIEIVDDEYGLFMLKWETDAEGPGCKKLNKIFKPMNCSEINNALLFFAPIEVGLFKCGIIITILDNPYEIYTIVVEGEAFIEDVILLGVTLLPWESERQSGDYLSLEMPPPPAASSGKVISAETFVSAKKKKKVSSLIVPQSSQPIFPIQPLKYAFRLGGLELNKIHQRNFIMLNHSKRMYKYEWFDQEKIKFTPNVGLLAPGQEKDIVIYIHSTEPYEIFDLSLLCNLYPLSSEPVVEKKGCFWDNRQIITTFTKLSDTEFQKRQEVLPTSVPIEAEHEKSNKNILLILYASLDYCLYDTDLDDTIDFGQADLFERKEISFSVSNLGNVALKLWWSFNIESSFPQKLMDGEKPPSPVESDECGGDGDHLEDEEEELPSNVTLFSCLDSISTDTFFERELPLSIEPRKCIIEKGDKRDFKVIFSPLSSFFYTAQLRSDIANLHPKLDQIACRVQGICHIPYCHFCIEGSDYLESGRRSLSLPPLDPDKKFTVIEFNELGPGSYKKKVKVLNPTKEPYNFAIERKSAKAELAPIHFTPSSGKIEAGSDFEILFTFTTTKHGVFEHEMFFIIEHFCVTINLLVVGIARQPNVTLDQNIIKLDEVLVGQSTAKEFSVINNENEPLKFKFIASSLKDEVATNILILTPDQGTLMPQSSKTMKLTYSPIDSGEIAFKVDIQIQHASDPLTLGVFAISHRIKARVNYYLQSHKHLLREDAVTHIHFDQTAAHYRRNIEFVITNEGTIPFNFMWEAHEPVKKYLEVWFEPNEGTLDAGKEESTLLNLIVHGIPVIEYPLILKIQNGATFKVFLHANIEEPIFRFSFMEYNFGMCFVNAPDNTYKKSLQLKNNDSVGLTLDLSYQYEPELMIDYARQGSVVMPNEILKIPISFRPKQVKEHEFKLVFRVNTLCERMITIKGQGVPLLYDLYEGADKNIDFGAVPVGAEAVREVFIVNNSLIPLDTAFSFKEKFKQGDSLNDDDQASECLSSRNLAAGEPSRVKQLKRFKKQSENETNETSLSRSWKALSIDPTQMMINPNEKKAIKIIFQPTELIRNFEVQVYMQIYDNIEPITEVRGSSTGMCLQLSQDSLQFGVVRLQGRKKIKFQLMNKGDMDTRFSWQAPINSAFSISPMEGPLAARTNVTVTATCTPQYKNPYLQCWAKCTFRNHSALNISLNGACVDINDYEVRTATFNCPVRESDTFKITISNPSDETWDIIPVKHGDEFQVEQEFAVRPKETIHLQIKYAPRYMGEHRGQLLLSPLGNTSLLFNLVGRAMAPNPNGMYELCISCNQPFTEQLAVKSISEEPETFLASAEILKIVPDNTVDICDIKMPKVVKVWGEATATCDFTITCYIECSLRIKVSFVDIQTKEYQYYLLAITVGPSVLAGTLELTAKARDTVEGTIVIRNPLNEKTKFTLYSPNADVTYPEEIEINGRSEGNAAVTYSPILAGEHIDFLEVGQPKIGLIMYQLNLKCLPPDAKILRFSTSFGSKIPMYFKVINRENSAAEFHCTVTNTSFLTEKSYVIPALDQKKFVVYFEPEDLGLHHGTVKFNSPLAGEFIYEIIGECTEPKPKGPIEIREGGSATLSFKNVLATEKTFYIYTDNTSFTVKKAYEAVKAKQELKIQVWLADNQTPDDQQPPRGALIIEPYNEQEAKTVPWTFFLQGYK